MTDPRRYCRDCLNLNKKGECMAATKLGASVKYRPVQDLLRNCREFVEARRSITTTAARGWWDGVA